MKKETEAPTSKLLAKELVARILNDTDCKTPLSTAYKIVASLELEGFWPLSYHRRTTTLETRSGGKNTKRNTATQRRMCGA